MSPGRALCVDAWRRPQSRPPDARRDAAPPPLSIPARSARPCHPRTARHPVHGASWEERRRPAAACGPGGIERRPTRELVGWCPRLTGCQALRAAARWWSVLTLAGVAGTLVRGQRCHGDFRSPDSVRCAVGASACGAAIRAGASGAHIGACTSGARRPVLVPSMLVLPVLSPALRRLGLRPRWRRHRGQLVLQALALRVPPHDERDVTVAAHAAGRATAVRASACVPERAAPRAGEAPSGSTARPRAPRAPAPLETTAAFRALVQVSEEAVSVGAFQLAVDIGVQQPLICVQHGLPCLPTHELPPGGGGRARAWCRPPLARAPFARRFRRTTAQRPTAAGPRGRGG